jgi:hypothetical protein
VTDAFTILHECDVATARRAAFLRDVRENAAGPIALKVN